MTSEQPPDFSLSSLSSLSRRKRGPDDPQYTPVKRARGCNGETREHKFREPTAAPSEKKLKIVIVVHPTNLTEDYDTAYNTFHYSPVPPGCHAAAEALIRDEVKRDKPLGLIHRRGQDEANHDAPEFLVSNLLHLYLYIYSNHQDRADIEVMALAAFIRGVARPGEAAGLTLQDADLVIGGIEFDNDFMDSRRGSNCFGKFSFLTVAAGLNRLVNSTTIWPHPDEVLYNGNKIEGLRDLQAAADKLSLPFPEFRLLMRHPYELLKEGVSPFDERPGPLLKRMFSDHGWHVVRTSDPGARALLREDYANRGKWKKAGFCSTPRWFVVPFNRHLISLGEIRVFMFEGRYQYAVVTKPSGDGCMEVEMVNSVMPLDQVLDRGSLAHDGFSNDPESAAAKIYLISWISQMHRILVYLDEQKQNNNTRESSGLRIFYRMDIGILVTPDRKAHYYVNEMARSHACAMFGYQGGDHFDAMMSGLADTLVDLAMRSQ